jgi:4-hydroxybenzoate polyprenyltransferase
MKRIDMWLLISLLFATAFLVLYSIALYNVEMKGEGWYLAGLVASMFALLFFAYMKRKDDKKNNKFE